ncbi:MAG: ion channel [Candidatus Latescibacter sp.]|nr:ion channel [Candidatus Latescibacter sp.]
MGQNDSPKKEPRFSQEQYDMLIRCSKKKDMTEWNEWREANLRVEILLEGANLWGTHLEHAYLESAHLENAFLWVAHLEHAKLYTAILDDSTRVWNCTVDRNTDFRGVGLGNIRIDPGTRQLLEYNIRRMNWEDWYKKHNWWNWPVKFFWWTSDYGRSTGRILGVFFGFAVLFSVFYYLCPNTLDDLVEAGTSNPEWMKWFRSLYFSIVTMTTLGFGDIHARSTSFWGHFFIILQVFLGYIILGALVTRLNILFTAGGPSARFAPEYIPPKEKGSESDFPGHKADAEY